MRRRDFLSGLGKAVGVSAVGLASVAAIPIIPKPKPSKEISYMALEIMGPGELYSVHDPETGIMIDREFTKCDAVNGWAEVFARNLDGSIKADYEREEIVKEIIYGNFEIRRMGAR